MVRAPCCDKTGLNKGPWSADEDRKLIAYVTSHGHANWRALPKQAGLMRCGKSCRLRWTNYLRPDIKRGNFSNEEEETIIRLHEKLGNRWSAIAARLPGRTDNEIKNVWHTHIKKRLPSATKPASPVRSHSNASSSVTDFSTTSSESYERFLSEQLEDKNYDTLRVESLVGDEDNHMNFWLRILMETRER